MWLIRVALSLHRSWQTDDPIVLVLSPEACRLRLESGCQSLAPRDALRHFDAMDRWAAGRIRQFVGEAGLTRHPLGHLKDPDLVRLVRQAIQDGRLVALRKAGDACKTGGDLAEQRRLVREIEKETRGVLHHAGRHYRLVADVDLGRTPGRNGYEVVPRDEAQRVLDGLAKQSDATAELAALLGKANDKLSADWRPPLTVPEGLVLLRRIPVLAAVAAPGESAMTPSQVKALLEQAQLEIVVVDLKDKPQAGLAFAIDAPDGTTVSGKLDENGRARARSTRPGRFTVTFPDLDGGDWEGDGAEGLAPEEDRTEVSRYAVAPGDRLPTIARAHGFARWQTIWDFSANQSLKRLRGSAHILLPGDQVVIPSKLPRRAVVPGGLAKFVVQSTAERLQVRFAGVYSSEEYPVTFKATPDTGSAIEGVLSYYGWLCIELPPDTHTVTVELYRSDATEDEPTADGASEPAPGKQADTAAPFISHEFTLGGLDPLDTISGIQARLFNLGFYNGAISGQLDDDTQKAISHFRWVALRDRRSDNDESFRNALRRAYSS